MNRVNPDDSSRLIASEEKRLDEVKRNEKIREHGWYKHVMTRVPGIPFEVFVSAMKNAKTFDDFVEIFPDAKIRQDFLGLLRGCSIDAQSDFNRIRIASWGSPPF